jgi:hypothetical protein
MVFLRVNLVTADSDERTNKFFFDILVNDEMIPAKKMAFFGVFGSINDETIRYPLILLPDGTMDFGSHIGPSVRFTCHTQTSRYWYTNLLDRPVRQGDLSTVWWTDPRDSWRELTTTYRTAAVSRLDSIEQTAS